jgi:ribosome-associated toxin RatA of RatAB toxin-antitoxin module
LEGYLGETAWHPRCLEFQPNPAYNMLLQKTLHINHSVAQCQAHLANIQSYQHQFPMVTKATVTSSKTVDFSFRGPLGFRTHTVLLAVEGDCPNQCAFESVGGNLELMGLIDFAEIRSNCTEVTLALHYEIKNKVFAWLDRHLHFVDTCVTAELRSIRAHFEGPVVPHFERAPILSMFETATA